MRTMQRFGASRHFALTPGWTFAFWGVVAVAGLSPTSLPGLLLFILAVIARSGKDLGKGR